MYERFTDRARKVLQLANQEAQRLNHPSIGAEHLLLGLVKEGDGLAAHVLSILRVDLHRLRREIERLLPPGSRPTPGKLPQDERARRALEYGIAESAYLGCPYVGSEHLLLGLLRLPDGVAAAALTNLVVRPDEVWDEVRKQARDSEPRTVAGRFAWHLRGTIVGVALGVILQGAVGGVIGGLLGHLLGAALARKLLDWWRFEQRRSANRIEEVR